MTMIEAIHQPMSPADLRRKHLYEALTSVVLFTAVALIFWAIKFGAGASPSVPRILMTVMLPVVLLKEYYLYVTARRRYGFDVARTNAAAVA